MYVTTDDLVTRVGERELIVLTDRADPPAGVIDQTAVDSAIAAAESEVDSYVGTRYPLPLSSVPNVVKDRALDIALYRLNVVSMPAHVKERYDDAVAWLRDVQAGRASLPGVVISGQSTGGGVVMVSSSPKVFGRDVR